MSEVGLFSSEPMVSEVGLFSSESMVPEVELFSSESMVSEVGLFSSESMVSEVGLFSSEPIALEHRGMQSVGGTARISEIALEVSMHFVRDFSHMRSLGYDYLTVINDGWVNTAIQYTRTPNFNVSRKNCN